MQCSIFTIWITSLADRIRVGMSFVKCPSLNVVLKMSSVKKSSWDNFSRDEFHWKIVLGQNVSHKENVLSHLFHIIYSLFINKYRWSLFKVKNLISGRGWNSFRIKHKGRRNTIDFTRNELKLMIYSLGSLFSLHTKNGIKIKQLWRMGKQLNICLTWKKFSDERTFFSVGNIFLEDIIHIHNFPTISIDEDISPRGHFFLGTKDPEDIAKDILQKDILAFYRLINEHRHVTSNIW